MLCRWRKPNREQLATRHYFDEFRASLTATNDDDIVVYRGINERCDLPGRVENGVIQRISIHSSKDEASVNADETGLLCCEYDSDVSVSV